jgi:hypothetical protein
MQVLLSQTTKKREEKQMKPITEFEIKFMNIFLESGIQMLPNSDRSAYNSDEDYEFVQYVTDRLIKFYSLYKVTEQPQVVGDKDW